MNNQDNEIWADVPGYEGKYKISNLGRVRSFDRFMNGRFIKGKDIKTFPMRKTGYYAFNCRAGVSKTFLLARLVGLLFVEKPDGWSEEWYVTALNRDKSDCRAENLKWVQEWPGLRKRAVVQLSKSGEFIKEYESIWEAGKENGIHSGNISYAVNPERTGNHTAGGYKWIYADEYYADNR